MEKMETPFEKIMAENFARLVKDIDTQVREVQRVPHQVDPKRPPLQGTSHHLIEADRPQTGVYFFVRAGVWPQGGGARQRVGTGLCRCRPCTCESPQVRGWLQCPFCHR